MRISDLPFMGHEVRQPTSNPIIYSLPRESDTHVGCPALALFDMWL